MSNHSDDEVLKRLKADAQRFAVPQAPRERFFGQVGVTNSGRLLRFANKSHVGSKSVSFSASEDDDEPNTKQAPSSRKSWRAKATFTKVKK